MTPYVYPGLTENVSIEQKIELSIYKHMNITKDELMKRCRKPELVLPRMLFMHLLMKEAGYSDAKAAKVFGLDRNTAKYADQQVEINLERKQFKLLYNHIIYDVKQ